MITKEEFLDADSKRELVEVWNDVFMQYEKKDGKIVGKLPKLSVDTGAGLERLAMTMQGVDNIYETDLLRPVMALMQNPDVPISNKRIIADHLRASIFLIADGVVPANTDRGYILRRLIRRAIMQTSDKMLDSERVGTTIDTFAEIYRNTYPELKEKSAIIKKILEDEAAKFTCTLAVGMKEFNWRIKEFKNGRHTQDELPPSVVFDLVTTYGFPFELVKELAHEKGMIVSEDQFKNRMEAHRIKSRVGAEQKFKGGLSDENDPMVVKYHTATHLLHQALHDVLGEGVMQKGSNITAERLRFDFAYGAKMTDEEKMKVEEIVNRKIAEALPVNQIVMLKEEAEKTGARHFFGEKYGEQVSVYFIGQASNPPTAADLKNAYSKEFCGGPHVKNTSELKGTFKIKKEEAVAQGVRRIKAVIE